MTNGLKTHHLLPMGTFSHSRYPSKPVSFKTLDEYEQDARIDAFLKERQGKLCKSCKTPLLNKRKSIRFCSLRCGQLYTWRNKRKNERCISKKCAYCVNLFIPKRNTQKYCSVKCSNKNRAKPILQLIDFLSGMISSNCFGCGKVIRLKRYKKYCSVKYRVRVINQRHYYKCKKERIEKSLEIS